MEKEKNVFARKAAERIEERKKLRTMRLMVKSVGMEVEIRGLTEEEIRDCMDFSDESIEVDKYTIYMASPTLQNAAKILDPSMHIATLGEGAKLSMDITLKKGQGYVSADKNKVLELSGMTGDAKIEVIREDEEIKNS